MVRHKHSFNSTDDFNKMKARLTDEIDELRRTILELMPLEVERKLSSFYSCDTRADFEKWTREVMDFVIARARPLRQSSYETRAACPFVEAKASRGTRTVTKCPVDYSAISRDMEPSSVAM